MSHYITEKTPDDVIKYITELEEEIRSYGIEPDYMWYLKPTLPDNQKYNKYKIQTLYIVYKYAYDSMQYMRDNPDLINSKILDAESEQKKVKVNLTPYINKEREKIRYREDNLYNEYNTNFDEIRNSSSCSNITENLYYDFAPEEI